MYTNMYSHMLLTVKLVFVQYKFKKKTWDKIKSIAKLRTANDYARCVCVNVIEF